MSRTLCGQFASSSAILGAMATSDRPFNFSPGPATLPEAVLRKTQESVWDLAGSGIGVMEHSHRGGAFNAVIERAESLCRELASIPDDYAVLFLQGGASLQFCMVPMNLLGQGQTADYINTGSWSKKAIKEAKKLGAVRVAGTSESENFAFIPTGDDVSYSDAPAYVHFTSNNTIFGTQFATEPAPPADSPLVCDASSDIFSRPLDIAKYGLVYAGAQKNLGPSGVTLVIVRKDLAERAGDSLPTFLQYRTHIEGGSRFNTPNTLGIYVIGEMFAWLKEHGGLAAMAERNREKAALLYSYLDESRFFRGTARPDSRSLMNVTFRAPDENLENTFVAEASAKGLLGLKGHRSVGGMRASIYNALPKAGVGALVSFMKDFERANT